jgi:flagellar biosynthesis/type III secretory pathway M-ring protein FliF/YscJ
VIENFWANAAYSVIPTILLGLIFWLVMRSIFRADRTERKVYAEIEAEERARFEAENAAAITATRELSA